MKFLEVAITEARYGDKVALRGVAASVGQGEILAVIGPNGSGKSTFLRCLAGLVDARMSLSIEGAAVGSLSVNERVRRGIAFVPQGQRVFNNLSVADNLSVGSFLLPSRDAIVQSEIVLESFPDLRSRRNQVASSLSGGEKQTLALARALVLSPRLLLLDEPSLGLAPPSRAALLKMLRSMASRTQLTVVIAEQRVRDVLAIADNALALRLGREFSYGPAVVISQDQKLAELFGIPSMTPTGR